MGFARETISVFGDWGFWGKLDMLTATGDEGGDGSGLFTAIGSGSPGVFAVLLASSFKASLRSRHRHFAEGSQ